MKAEATKRFEGGFVLTEQELRRLIDILLQQMKRIPATADPIVTFEIDFRNGATAQAHTVDEILSLENAGSATVIALKIMVQDIKDNKNDEFEEMRKVPNNRIYVEFTNPSAEDYIFRDTSIRYIVKGEDRDWVFVTSSELEERINRINIFAIGRFLRREYNLIVVMLSMLILLLSVTFNLGKREAQKDKLQLAAIDKIEQAYKTGAIKDPVEAIIAIEKEGRRTLPRRDFLRTPLLIAGVAVLFLVCLKSFTARLCPEFNFCWGDYLGVYERKLAIRRYILIAVITGIIVSVIGGLIVNHLAGIR